MCTLFFLGASAAGVRKDAGPILGRRGMNLRWDVGTEEDGEKLE